MHLLLCLWVLCTKRTTIVCFLAQTKHVVGKSSTELSGKWVSLRQVADFHFPVFVELDMGGALGRPVERTLTSLG